MSMREDFEAWWAKEMNVAEFSLDRCEFPMLADEDQPYRDHETGRGWLAYAAGRKDERKDSQGTVLMGECMDMVRQDLIDAGVVEKTVPPMMIPEAVAAAMRKAVSAEREACRRACREAVLSLPEDQRQSGDLCDHAIDVAIRNRKDTA